MAVTNYYTIDGQMLGYKDAGGRKDFLTDALGSVTGEVDGTGTNRTFNGRYKPYGGMLWSSGSRGSFGWVGTWGYRSTGLKNISHYIRARHYSQVSGTWTTQDPLWPAQRAYGYVSNPIAYDDKSGLAPSLGKSCISSDQNFGGAISDCLFALCRAVSSPEKMRKIKNCTAGKVKNNNLETCLKNWCSAQPKINCSDCKDMDSLNATCLRRKSSGSLPKGAGSNGWTDLTGPLPPRIDRAAAKCPADCESFSYLIPVGYAHTNCYTGQITICKPFYDGTYGRDCDCQSGKPFSDYVVIPPNATLIHEILHVCGQCHGVDQDSHQGPFDEAAQCIKDVVGCK